MEGFVTHCGASEVQLQDVLAVPVPQYTASHRPVAYGDLTTFVERQIQVLGLDTLSKAYALNAKGQHFFARYVLGVPGDEEQGLSIVFRQSYDKKFRCAIAMGVQTFICDNLSISGSYFKVMYKNTMNGWDNFKRDCLVGTFDTEPLRAYHEVKADFQSWGTIQLTKVEGYRMLGELLGGGIITPHQAGVAFEDWQTPRHAEFADRNLLNLYQCVTEGLKKGQQATLPERHIAAHEYVQHLALAG